MMKKKTRFFFSFLLTRLSDCDQGVNAGLHHVQYLRKPGRVAHPPPSQKNIKKNEHRTKQIIAAAEKKNADWWGDNMTITDVLLHPDP